MAQVHANWTDGHRGISRQTLMTRVHFNDYSFFGHLKKSDKVLYLGTVAYENSLDLMHLQHK